MTSEPSAVTADARVGADGTVMMHPHRTFQGVLRAGALASILLVAGVIAALVWANIGGYEEFWRQRVGISVGSWSLTYELRTWVNSGLMTLFFLAVGLEARREFDLGDLRERKRLILPITVGLVGMALPVAIFLVVNRGLASAGAWGVTMSTDTALALGILTLLARRAPKRTRTFLLTAFVVDDVVALIVIAALYSGPISLPAVMAAVVSFVLLLAARRLNRTLGRNLAVVLGVLTWFFMLLSGIDPVVSGLAIGLSTSAYVPVRADLERATDLFRDYRVSPSAELAHSAAAGLADSLSENERILYRLSPWTSYVVVPIFALANAGVAITPDLLGRAFTSPITIGIVLGYVVGKPISVVGSSWLLSRMTRGRIHPQVGWLSVLGSGTAAGVGFTVSLLIAGIALTGPELGEAKIGIFLSVIGSAALTWLVFFCVRFIPANRRTTALNGRPDPTLDLLAPPDPELDHVRGAAEPAVTVVEYGDFECGFCKRGEPTVRELMQRHPDVAVVWRHLPLTDVHPNALRAAEAAEAAGAQGAFWPMHDMLLDHQDRLGVNDLEEYARQIGIDVDRFRDDLQAHAFADRVRADIRSADESGAAGTPTYFINGQRHEGDVDIDSLSKAINGARAALRNG
ncbi:Na+/H+ antiporter NhaA [Leifsonia shinshuensis]|uniref:Na+/H+ antiporter NhaA n=1 Tax=Leifsonia shinshuensis TaxID=150026 RepID=UPI0028635FF9|nr:Na+/H+ antiporter NhaA [Leifsonia shinshuensis]MDR6972799.1 Na+/H+ antiporter NhaA/protein-disulfide isomerase [Leifsonia shinshuensis]